MSNDTELSAPGEGAAPAARSEPRRWWRAAKSSGDALSSVFTPSSLPGDEPLFAALFEHSAEGLLLCRADGKVLAGNAAAAERLGLSRRRLVGRRIDACLAQSDLAPEPGFVLATGPARARHVDSALGELDLRLTPVAGVEPPRWIVHVQSAEALRAEDRLAALAHTDSLTGLPNRTLFRDRLAQAMKRARRNNRAMALMFLDLDRFKHVNDGLGHEVGDRLLQHVAQALVGCVRGTDSVSRSAGEATVSRLGGDEFTVIAEDVGSSADAALLAQRMLDALQAPFRAGKEEIVVTSSIGVAMYPSGRVDLDGLIRRADMAMYRSKALGRNTCSFFTDDLDAAVTARVSLEASLRGAIERQEFQLHYQPKADLASGRIVGVEALLRWHRPGRGLVAPDEFIGVLEETGMVLPVGAWVIRAACAQLAEWDRAGLPPLRMAVNLSARQFRHLYLGSLVADSLREHAIDPKRFEVELTESLLMEDTEVNRAILANLRRMGVGLAIDDFGTGHSSLTYLKRFAIDTLKIDRSFIRSLPHGAEDAAIAGAVIALGHSLQMRVVAEGVETEVQAQALRDLGCDEIQGYLLSPALPGPALARWLQPRHRQDCIFGQVRDTSPITLFSLGDES